MAIFPTTRAELIERVHTRLAPGVMRNGSISRELSPSDYESAVDDAMMEIVTAVGQKTQVAVTLTGATSYAFPSGCDRIIEIIPPGTQVDLMMTPGITTGFGWENEGFPVDGAFALHNLPLSNLTISAMYNKSFKEVYGSKFRWESDHLLRTYAVYPPETVGECVVVFISNTIDISKLEARLSKILYNLVFADMKMRLGGIRKKYGDGPIGISGSVALDGADLYAEGQELRDATLMELRSYDLPGGGLR